MSEQEEAMQAVITELSEFTYQDDCLMTYGSLLHDDILAETIHISTVERIVKIAFAAGRALENEECAKIVDAWHINSGGYSCMAYKIRQRQAKG